MRETATFGIEKDAGTGWIRLRTMIMLRWAAIFGQVAAITVAQKWYNLQLELGLCYLVVGVSVIGNMIAIFVFPENKRMSEVENFFMTLFDLLQLSFLLYLTGGLNNPFALLLLGPVCVSAAVLSLRFTVILGVLSFAIVTILANFNVPLRSQNGFIMTQPDIFLFGNYIALVIALVFLSAYSRRIAVEIRTMSEAVQATHMALSREQKLTDIGGVVAAAAHELGTPLATIKLTSAELMSDLEDRPELAEDAALIREQADRCRDILRSMGRAGKDDLHMRTAVLSAILDEAAEPHIERGKDILFEHGFSMSRDTGDQPLIVRQPEIIHGLRNLVQNAVDFAKTTVWIETRWSEDSITVRIIDDGPGYPTNIIGRIGDPFMRRRKTEADRKARPGYEGMGLGLFIAKTLLERSGAELTFANGSSSKEKTANLKSGAIVQVTWERHSIDAKARADLKTTRQNAVNPTH